MMRGRDGRRSSGEDRTMGGAEGRQQGNPGGYFHILGDTGMRQDRVSS